MARLQDLPDRVRADHALDVEAPGDVGGERARPHPRRPADEHHYRLGGLAKDAPLVQPADDYGVLLDQLVPDPGQHLLLLDHVALLRPVARRGPRSLSGAPARAWRPPGPASAPGCHGRTESP